MSDPPEEAEGAEKPSDAPANTTHEGRDASGRDPLVAQLRSANEKLVLSALRAQGLAAEAIEARERLERTEAALIEANRRKDVFLAMLGHELRNPLAPILTALELMRMRGDGSSLREREVIERQVRHMVELVDDLLDVSRITTGKVLIRRVPVQIADVVAKAIETAMPLIETRRHRLAVEVPHAGLAVYGDVARLAQVIANLLVNSAKYTEPGGTITVSARRESGRVRVCVEDDGCGIAPELLPTIFDRFVQAEQSIERARGGLGLGLAIVKSLVELHDGEVWAHSDGPGTGSAFVVRLPALDPESASPREGARGTDQHTALAEPSARRVLVVDDNVDAAEMLAEQLMTQHYEVVVAHDGPSALRAAADASFDSVVLDIGLPLMDGYEVARALRQSAEPSRAQVRLIALTGYGQEKDRERSASAGFDVHLVKPVDFDALQAALASPLRRDAERH